MKELFQLATPPPLNGVPQDSDFKGFRTLATLQNVTTEHLRAYQDEASALARALLRDTERRDRVVGCDPAAAGCLRSFVEDFGSIAYRRALSSDEVAALLEVAEQTGGSVDEQFSAVTAAMLTSASFLFRMELGDSMEGLSRLSGEELASRLSFTLLGRGPSKALLERGRSGELDSEQGLAAVVRELLSDDRAKEYFDAFFQQWMDFEQLRPPNELPSWWNDSLMLSMTEETRRLLDEYAWGEGKNFFDALTANHTYIRADLAEFYRLPAPAASGRVEFPAGHDREGSGLLTHAALISAKGDGDRIAHRGAWLLKTFSCVELTVPTELLDAVSDELAGLTYRQMLDKRNSEQNCAGCHALIDPIGAGFAAYDAAGRFDSGIDVVESFGITPALPGGGEFSNIGELASQLRARPDLTQCLTSRVFLYTGGREVAAQDRCSVNDASARFDAEGGRFSAVLEGLVASPAFRLRRAPAESTN